MGRFSDSNDVSGEMNYPFLEDKKVNKKLIKNNIRDL